MKARVKATGEIVEVIRFCSTVRGDLFECLSTGKRFFHDEIEFEEEYDEPNEVKQRVFTLYTPKFMREETTIEAINDIDSIRCMVEDIHEEITNTPDYWTRLEHQAVIAAMQGFLAGRMEDTYKRVAEFSINQAHALVEKLKEKEESV